MDAIEKRARELLAFGYEEDGLQGRALQLRDPAAYIEQPDRRALRAITVALLVGRPVDLLNQDGASRIKAEELQVVPSAALGADEAGAVGVDQVSGGLPRDIQLAEVASEHKAGVRPEGDAQATGGHVAAERVLRRLAADWRYQASNARSNRACLIRCAHQLEATVTTLMPPDGYVLVPLVLPVEMEIAFMEAWVSKRRCVDDPEMQDAWAAALAVRPEVL